jgi:hypothetical protein
VGVTVGVLVIVGVLEGVLVNVDVGVGVNVGVKVGVRVGVKVDVKVGVGVGVGVQATKPQSAGIKGVVVGILDNTTVNGLSEKSPMEYPSSISTINSLFVGSSTYTVQL